MSGEGVQQGLLKIIEGTIVSVPPKGGRMHPHQESVAVDTTDILFICGGAFSGLDKIVVERSLSTSIGFGAEVRGPDDRNSGDILKNVEPEDLRRFGMIPELVGRLPVIATLTELDVAALVAILTEPRNALIKQFRHLVEMECVRLEFSEGALRMIAETAIGRRMGARGLRSIVEDVRLETMFELPDLDGLEEVAIDRKTVERRRKPRYSDADRRRDLGSSVPLSRRSGSA